MNKMNKQQKFILFVQTILSARQTGEEEAIRILSKAFDVKEKDLNNKNKLD